MRRTSTLAIVLALLCGCARPDPETFPLAADASRLDPRVRPTSQSIALRLDPGLERYGGTVGFELEVTAATETFRFHAQDLTLERIDLRGTAGRIAVATEPGDDGMVLARATPRLLPGVYSLEIDFTGRFGTQAVGLYRVEHEGQSYLFTQFEALDARKAFPCWDEPIFKIPFQLTLGVPAGHEAVTNTSIASEKTEDGWRTMIFRRTPPLPTYLLAIATGPLESLPIPGMSIPGRIVTVRGQSRLAGTAAEMTPPLLAALERYFGSPYPYEKLDLIAVPEFWPGAMENPGAITYDDSILLVDPQTAGLGERRTLAVVTAHELAHIWFGDLVTMKWWNDLWLNESFASWLGDKIADEVHPGYGIDLASRGRVERVFSSDARPSTRPIRKPVRQRADVMEGLGLAYSKGQTVLGMVEEWIGPEAVRQGVIDYLERHAWGNAEAADLWNAFARATDAEVANSLESFLDQPGYPLVRFELGPQGALRVRQQRFLNHGVQAADQTWILPLRLAFAVGGEIRTRTVLLGEREQEFDLGAEPEWVLPNAGARGYYRWVLPAADLLRLASGGAEIMQPRERAAFLGNAAALLDAGALSGGAYLKILNAFAEDPDPEVVSSLISSLDKVQLSFVHDAMGEAFARYVRATLGPALARFGLEARPGEAEAVALFRPRLFQWLGDEGRDPEVRKTAARLADSYMKDKTSIDPALAEVALAVAAIEGDQERFLAYKQGFEEARAPAERDLYLQALGSFGDRKLQDEALAYALEDTVRPTEMFTIPRAFPDTDEARDRLLSWLMHHFDTIRSGLPPDNLPMLPFFASGCSQTRLGSATEFFRDPSHSFEGAERALDRLADQVTDCVALREREGPSVTDYLLHLP